MNVAGFKRKSLVVEVVAAIAIIVQACAGDPALFKSSTTSTSSEGADAENAMGAYISFSQFDYFSLMEPMPGTYCAGDAKTYYRPFDYQMPAGDTLSSIGSSHATYRGPSSYLGALGSTGPVPFDFNDLAGMSYKPKFIKNISVDLTDTNTTLSSNNAYSCSQLTSPNSPGPSNCATFDYGAIAGVPATLGGSLLMVGGVYGYNYSGILPVGVTGTDSFQGLTVGCGPGLTGGTTNCSQSMFALGIDTLPAKAAGTTLAPGILSASNNISSWSNLGVSATTGPLASAGASMVFSSGVDKILHYGGVGPVDGVGPTGPAADRGSSWIYNLEDQEWTKASSTANVALSIRSAKDGAITLSKDVGPRARFGYVSVPNMALTSMTTDGLVASSTKDTVERIVATAGKASDDVSKKLTYKINPTFGPEYYDVFDGAAADDVIQWAQNHFVGLMGIMGTHSSKYLPEIGAALAETVMTDIGLVRLNHSDGVGHVAGIGGFDSSQSVQNASVTNGRIYISRRSGLAHSTTAAFSAVPVNPSGTGQSPVQWTEFDTGAPIATANVAWYGGAVTLPGFNLTTNDVVYFGGTDLVKYLSLSSCSAYDFNHSGNYYRLTSDFTLAAATIPGWAAGTAPKEAGLAAARGRDGGGKVIIIAYGGIAGDATCSAADTNIHVLYNAGTLAVPSATWITKSTGSTRPHVLANASMVYSHVTRKFYLFGGYDKSGVVKAVNDTWELSVSGTCPDCTFTWKQLNTDGTSGGTTYYPSAPTARHSHRMVEVSYNTSVAADADGEPVCTDEDNPCSFGIFMEGGETLDGVLLADRWMFDPTANSGMGHWQKVDSFPPRRSAAMASVEYFVPALNKIVHRAVMFGGETALMSPRQGQSGEFYLPPILADSETYDFDANTWNRIELLGKGYFESFSDLSQYEARQAYIVIDPGTGYEFQSSDIYTNGSFSTTANANIATLSPPPLAGAMMVTRTHYLNSTGIPTPLSIPEIFLLGGRTNTGLLKSITSVYKFCSGSTGEQPRTTDSNGTTYDDASCDAYDSTKNPDSPSPSSGYVGRWLLKTPATPAGAEIGSYQGAVSYDVNRDRIVLFSGLSTSDVTTFAITNEAEKTSSTTIYEYTPPSKIHRGSTAAQKNGVWASVSACTGHSWEVTPTARFGHTMAYDKVSRQLVIVGGYDVDGTPLTQAFSSGGYTYTIPEVLTAKYIANENEIPADATDIAATPCYLWREKTTFGNSPTITTQTPPTNGISHAAAVYIDSSGYNTGYYTTIDSSCAKAGPIASSDDNFSKLLAGGVYIDIDRSELGPNENLLLNLTYYPLGTSNNSPSGGNFTSNESAIFRIHLMKTGYVEAVLQSILQPRHLYYANEEEFPQTVKTLNVLAPPTGVVRQEQMIVPISIDSGIDRIRIERYSGSAILIDATIMRMGYK